MSLINLSSKDNLFDVLPKDYPNIKSIVIFGDNATLGNIIKIIYNLPNLKTWYLTNRAVLHFDDIFKTKNIVLDSQIKNLKNLKQLTIESCNLKTIPDALYELINLEELNFTQIPIKTVSLDIQNLKKLKELTICKCTLESMPESICNLTNLETLILIHDTQKTVSQNFDQLKNLTNLKKLELMRHNFETIPDDIYELINLKTLLLVSNNIKVISPKIGQLINLEELDLTNNPIKTLPIEINKLENLETIMLPLVIHTSIGYNIGGLYRLKILNYRDPGNKSFSYKGLCHIFNNKMLLIDCREIINIPDTITHINCHQSIERQINNLPVSLRYFQTILFHKNINFSPMLEELHILYSKIPINKLRLPYGCKVYIGHAVSSSKLLY